MKKQSPFSSVLIILQSVSLSFFSSLFVYVRVTSWIIL